jgi:uncharacterized protein (DUF934 family)
MGEKLAPGDEVEMWQNGRRIGVHIVQFIYPDGRAYTSAAVLQDHHCPHVKRRVITLADDA